MCYRPQSLCLRSTTLQTDQLKLKRKNEYKNRPSVTFLFRSTEWQKEKKAFCNLKKTTNMLLFQNFAVILVINFVAHQHRMQVGNKNLAKTKDKRYSNKKYDDDV